MYVALIWSESSSLVSPITFRTHVNFYPSKYVYSSVRFYLDEFYFKKYITIDMGTVVAHNWHSQKNGLEGFKVCPYENPHNKFFFL